MTTKKITLNELRSLVRQIINESESLEDLIARKQSELDDLIRQRNERAEKKEQKHLRYTQNSSKVAEQQKNFDELKKWIDMTGGEDIAKKRNKIFFNDGFNMSLQILQHDGGRKTFDVKYPSEYEQELEKSSSNTSDTPKGKAYHDVSARGIVRIIEKHKGIDLSKSL